RRSPLLESLLAGVCSAEHAGRVHKKVDRLDSLHRGVERLRLRRIGYDISRTHLRGRRAQRLLAPGSQHNVVAEFGELASARLPDAAAAPADQRCSHTAPL